VPTAASCSKLSTAPDWATAVAPYADLSEMTRMWALDKYVGRWDGYAGEKRGAGGTRLAPAF
jgi:hypothetical protein